MCQHGTLKKIYVIRWNNPSVPDGWHEKYVDACIADEIQELNNKGILTTGCCCGHFEPELQADSAHSLVDIDSWDDCVKLGYEPYDFFKNNYEHGRFAIKLKSEVREMDPSMDGVIQMD